MIQNPLNGLSASNRAWLRHEPPWTPHVSGKVQAFFCGHRHSTLCRVLLLFFL